MLLVCSDWVPPITAASACRVTRTTLFSGCWAVRVEPPVCVWMKGPQAGQYDLQASFVQIDAPNVILTAFKISEDGNGFILRLIETSGLETQFTISLPHVSLREARETTPVEEDLHSLACQEHQIHAGIAPLAIKTIRGMLK